MASSQQPGNYGSAVGGASGGSMSGRKMPRFIPPEGANIQMGPESTHDIGPQPFSWLSKKAIEIRSQQQATKEWRPGQFGAEEAKRQAYLKKHPLPETMGKKEIEKARFKKIKEAIMPSGKRYRLRDEDLDDPEVAFIFDQIYPHYLPPLPGIRYQQGKNRLHKKRWMRKSQWDYFWRHSIQDQIDMFNSRPNLKIFFDYELGKDTIELIRHPKTKRAVPIFNELDLVPSGFPRRSDGGDPYLSLQTFDEGELVELFCLSARLRNFLLFLWFFIELHR